MTDRTAPTALPTPAAPTPPARTPGATPPARSAVLTGAADPLTKARLLAALIGGPMDPAQAERWLTAHDAAAALDELLAAGSVRRTAGGGLALHARRRDAALSALADELRVPLAARR